MGRRSTDSLRAWQLFSRFLQKTAMVLQKLLIESSIVSLRKEEKKRLGLSGGVIERM